MSVIQIVIGRLKKKDMNGVTYVVRSLALALENIGVDVQVWGIVGGNGSSDTSLFKEFSLFKRNIFHFTNFSMLRRIWKNRNEDVIYHLHGGWNAEMHIAAFMIRMSGSNYIVSPHGAFNKRKLNNIRFLKKLYFKYIVRYYLSKASRVHFYSSNEYYSIKNEVIDIKPIYVPNGIDRPEPVTLVNRYEEGQIIFGYLGRLEIKHKGLDILVNGFGNYVKNGGDGELWIAGSGESESLLRQMVKDMALCERVSFLGPLYGSDKEKFFQKVDVFMHPSKSEGMPISVLEAISYGKIVVISVETNMEELVKSAQVGYVLPKNSPNDISVAMKIIEAKCAASDEKSWEEHISRCNDLIKVKANWTVIANKFLLEYKGLM